MDLKLDIASDDIDVSTGDLVLVEGTDAIIQHLQIRLRFFLGEWFWIPVSACHISRNCSAIASIMP